MLKYLIPLLFLMVTCKKKQHISQKRQSEINALNMMDTLQEPFLNSMPDSMKKWISVFAAIRKADQKYRSVSDPDLLKNNSEKQIKLDLMNQATINSFLEKYGYPTLHQVGLKAMLAISMVIQHSDIKMQEKYYPYVKHGYINGTIPGEILALLEDRINALNKRYQFYGTQLITYKKTPTPFPLYNVDSVDIYRKRIGLNKTLGAYLKLYFNVQWDVSIYKKILPELLKTTKANNLTGIHFQK